MNTMPNIDADEAGTNLLQLVSFFLGAEEYGVDILKVQEINRMTAINKIVRAQAFVEGIINLRGTVIPVINLRVLFGLARKELDRQTRIIVVEVEGKTIGFVVDAVSEVLRIPRSMVGPPSDLLHCGAKNCIMGIGRINDKLLTILDVDAIVNEIETVVAAIDA